MPWDRNEIAARVAEELEVEMHVNLGIGHSDARVEDDGAEDLSVQRQRQR